MSESVMSLLPTVNRLLADPASLAQGWDRAAQWALAGELLAIVVGGFAAHGITLGLVRPGWQTFASALKAPLVPLLSLLVTLPLLHALALVVSGGGGVAATVALSLVPLAVAGLLLGAATPLLVFFGATSDYHFCKLLHVGTTSLGGLAGALALLRTLRAADGASPTVFLPWVLVFFFVAAQMAWTLRPFIGAPDQPFRWVAARGGRLNFYSAVALSLRDRVAPATAPAPQDRD
ncbi:MAG: hypothetical protein SF028_13630 [Candidatus Sumerlaeia bacterium]|nr:hypothetical protein [Candidatus Sumerlaeia bacterium]